MKKQVSSGKSKRDLTKMTTPHTYVIIFGVVILAWLLTFIVPAGKFSTKISNTKMQMEKQVRELYYAKIHFVMLMPWIAPMYLIN